MDSILTVLTPSPTYDLTVLATVKREIGISGTADDAWLADEISNSSADFAGECNRVFASESVSETFRLHHAHCYGRASGPETIRLKRYPVTEIASVSVDGETLDPSLCEADRDSGLLYRLDSCGNRIRWSGRTVVVAYTGGYTLLTGLPRDIERAVLELIKVRYAARKRDPLVKSVTIEDVGTEQYWVGPVPGASDSGYPQATQRAIDRYRDPGV